MGRAIDVLITYRIIKMLITPFEKQDAYKYGIIDKNGKVIRPCILWNDTRSYQECEEFEKQNFDVRSISGNITMPGFTAPKINWLINPIIKFLGAFITLAKSENVKPKPRVNIIKAKAKGRITSVMKFIYKY